MLDSQDGYDVTHYLLDLDFNDVSRVISGSVTITATSLVPDLLEIVLDLAPEIDRYAEETLAEFRDQPPPAGYRRPAPATRSGLE